MTPMVTNVLAILVIVVGTCGGLAFVRWCFFGAAAWIEADAPLPAPAPTLPRVTYPEDGADD